MHHFPNNDQTIGEITPTTKTPQMDHNTRTPNAKTEQNETQNNTTATHMFFLLSQKATNPTVAPAPGKRSERTFAQL